MAGRHVLLLAVAAAVVVEGVTPGCTHNNHCDPLSCCIIGQTKFSIPNCSPFGGVGSYCKPNNEPHSNTLYYPEDIVVELEEGHLDVCPCQPGLTCTMRTCQLEDGNSVGLPSEACGGTEGEGTSRCNPDNIVYGAQLLDILHEKLRSLQCLCCEKIFKTHKMLREHMRKQQHRCLNPKNKIYDKFYLRNYLRPGMPWEKTKRDLDEESDTESVSEESGQAVKFQEEPEWTDWQEVNIHPTTCLFCPFTTTKVPVGLFSHMKVHHNFDFEHITHNFDFYQKVKVVNYIRHCMSEFRCLQCQSVFGTCEAIQEHLSHTSHYTLPHPLVWDLPQYHIPVCDNDGLLQHLEDGEMDEHHNTQGSLMSVADQMVYPEDLEPLNDSILHNSSLREEIIHTEDKEVDLVVRCLFCCYTVPGERAHLHVYAHMSTLHCFNFQEVVSGLSYYTQVKLINYMRRKTAQKKCYVCSQVFQGRGALEEHRVLASHTSLPPTHLFQDQSWLKPVLEGDGLLQRLREEGDSDDEDPSVPDSSRKEVMFGEDVELPLLTKQLQAITMELLKNDDF